MAMMATRNKLPEVCITPEAKARLDLYIDLVDGEVSGLGRVVSHHGALVITDIYLLRQECSATTTELHPEDVSNFLVSLIQQGVDPSELKLWWHSHADMSVFWSGTDEKTASQFGNGWMLSVVGNKRGDYLCRYDQWEPVDLMVNEIPLQIALPYDPALEDALAAEVEEKVAMKKWVATPYVNPYMRNPLPQNKTTGEDGVVLANNLDFLEDDDFDDQDWWDGRWQSPYQPEWSR